MINKVPSLNVQVCSLCFEVYDGKIRDKQFLATHFCMHVSIASIHSSNPIEDIRKEIDNY